MEFRHFLFTIFLKINTYLIDMNIKKTTFVLGILWGLFTNFKAQTLPPPSTKIEVDYTIPKLEILNKELLFSLDTLSLPTVSENKPYSIFSFFPDNEEAQLYLSYELPPVIIQGDTIFGFLDYKGYEMIIENPPPYWFKPLQKKKRFKGVFYLKFGGGNTAWYFTFSNNKVVEVIKGILE